MLISHKKVGEEVVQRVTEDGTKGCDGGGLTGGGGSGYQNGKEMWRHGRGAAICESRDESCINLLHLITFSHK
jgi:hypothetical protein